MKCPNCASDVPDNSNFCGVCGTDIRAHRAQAANETLVIDSETRAAMFESVKEHAAPALNAESSIEEDSMSSTMVDAEQPISPEAAAEPQPKSEDAIAQTEEPEQNVQPATPKSEQDQPAQPEKPKSEPAHAEAPAPKKQSKEVVIETSANLPVPEAAKTPDPAPSGGTDKDGGFRETLWFMQAQNPESIEAIDNVDVRHLADSYEDKGNAMDTQLRQQFSLNVSDEPVAVPKPQAFDTQAFQSIDIPGVSKKGKYVAMIAVVAVLGAAVWFFLR